MVERVLGQKVSPRDHAMIDCLAERMERYGWHSVSINPVPLGYQYIIQAKSEKRREDEARQRAAQDAAQPQPTATFAAPPVAPPAAAAAPAAASQAHSQHQQAQQARPNESPEGWTRVGKGGQPDRFTMKNFGRNPPKSGKRKQEHRKPAPKGGGPPPPSPKVVDKNRLSALGAGPSGTSGSTERAPPRSPSPTSPPAKSPRPSAPASGYDSKLEFSDAEARDRVAGVVHDAVQQAVMQYGYDDELYQAWRDGEIGEKDFPEEVMAMTFDLCER